MSTTSETHLHFLSHIGREKFAQQNGDPLCPFCHRDKLAEILDEEPPLIWVKNKYPTIAESFQTVLIETDDCTAHIQDYTPLHMQSVITFGIDRWTALEKSGEYRSVAFFKNFGPQSGGSIEHAHMQIVGLEKINYRNRLNDAVFEGVEIFSQGSSVLNISTNPLSSTTEFNIIVAARDDAFMARCIQQLVRTILTYTDSYNIFFYEWQGAIICKVVPRWVTSPYLIGYSIPQTSSWLDHVVQSMQKLDWT